MVSEPASSVDEGIRTKSTSFVGWRGIKVHLIKAEHLVSFLITTWNIWSCKVYLSKTLCFLKLCELCMHHFLHFLELIMQSKPTRTRPDFYQIKQSQGWNPTPLLDLITLMIMIQQGRMEELIGKKPCNFVEDKCRTKEWPKT